MGMKVLLTCILLVHLHLSLLIWYLHVRLHLVKREFIKAQLCRIIRDLTAVVLRIAVDAVEDAAMAVRKQHNTNMTCVLVVKQALKTSCGIHGATAESREAVEAGSES